MHHDKRANAQQLTAQVNQLLLVEHIDILIAALIGYMALLRLPRAFFRLWTKSEWSEGHFLQYQAVNGWRLPNSNRGDANPIKENPSSESVSATTGKPHFSHKHSVQRLVDSQVTLRPTYPPHIPAYPAFLHPFVERLRLSVVPGYSNLQVLLMLAYLGILLYGFSYRSNFLENPIRSGLVAASQLPFVYAFSAKNNVPGLLLGIGYQSVCFLYFWYQHPVTLVSVELFPPLCRASGCPCGKRSCYWLVYVLNFIYPFYIMILVVYKWTVLHTISTEFTNPSNRWGLVTLTCMDIIFVFSTSIVREKAYNIFRITHLVGYVLIVPAVSGFVQVPVL